MYLIVRIVQLYCLYININFYRSFGLIFLYLTIYNSYFFDG